ncbi:MAG: DUF2330 domain-containing protein [Pirellulales bacterium]
MFRRLAASCVRFVAAISVALNGVAAQACCPAPPAGSIVLNADQTVVILWDAAKKTQHFIRRASFHSEADNFGFLIPSPTAPELAESGDAVFPDLLNLTKPEIQYVSRPRQMSCGCESKTTTSGSAGGSAAGTVHVLLEKAVAGFNAVVLDATSTDALVEWLRDHHYAYSPEVAAWAKPYVEGGWKITALKVAKQSEELQSKTVDAKALRMSFQTDRPLFPYREPDYGPVPAERSAKRTLRIYFLGDKRYGGTLTPTEGWTGKTVWSNPITKNDRTRILNELKLPGSTGPETFVLTEFEDDWAYRKAPADVYFDVVADQSGVKRPKVIVYTAAATLLPHDVAAYALVAAVVMPVVWSQRRRKSAA